MRSAELRALSRRCVITGIGALSGPAAGVDAFWELLTDTTEQPTVTTLESFTPEKWIDRRMRRHTDLFTQLALAAGQLAADDAGLCIDQPERAGVVVSIGNISATTATVELADFDEKGEAAVSALAMVRSLPNAPASALAIQHGVEGPAWSLGTGCSSATHAVGEAARLVQLGFVDVALGGGADSWWCAGGGERAEHAAGIMRASVRNLKVTTDQSVGRPFSAHRKGFVPGDGACILVLETLERARDRGAHIYAEICGYGNTNDAHDLIAPKNDGSGIRRAMALAIADAGAVPADVKFVNAHGSGTPSNDAAEATAIAELFGAPGPAVNGTKGRTGHVGHATGALEAASVALAIDRALIPATAGLDEPDPALASLDLVYGANRTWAPGLSLSNSLGFGGHNGCVALRPVDER